MYVADDAGEQLLEEGEVVVRDGDVVGFGVVGEFVEEDFPCWVGLFKAEIEFNQLSNLYLLLLILLILSDVYESVQTALHYVPSPLRLHELSLNVHKSYQLFVAHVRDNAGFV